MNSPVSVAYIFHLFILKEPESLSHSVLGCTTTLNNRSEKSNAQMKLEFADTACEFTHKNSNQKAFQE